MLAISESQALIYQFLGKLSDVPKGSRSCLRACVVFGEEEMPENLKLALLGLYQSHALGDGHGFGSPVAITPAKPTEPKVVPESAVQRKKRAHHDRAQAREIAEKIRQFAALGDCDHD